MMAKLVAMTVEVRRGEKKKGWYKRAMDVFKTPKAVVKVGFPKGTNADNIMKAIWNEFGTRGGRSGGGWGGPVPERSFMRTAMRTNQQKYQDAMRVSAPKILSGETNLRQALSKLGIVMQSDIQSQIASNMPPPNAELTVKLKGSSKTLIDTGAMRQGVTWVLEVKK